MEKCMMIKRWISSIQYHNNKEEIYIMSPKLIDIVFIALIRFVTDLISSIFVSRTKGMDP
jgi:hypothetical protein